MNNIPSPMKTMFMNMKNFYLYKLVKIETILDTNHEQYGVELVEAIRVGDGKPLRIPQQVLKSRYEMLTEEESSELGLFLANNQNPKNLPIKYKHGVFDYGHESEAWRPDESNKISKEFEKLIEQQKVQSLSIGTLISPNENDLLSNVVTTDSVKESIKVGLAKIKYQDFLNNQWNLKSLDASINRSILNFYGPPGTGKTLSAKSVARELNQKLLQVDYSQVESKWVGETGKNIQKIFKLAQENNAIILLDEADSLVSKRSQDGMQPNYVNENRNIFMQEMDKFKGVVILTTNLFQNYDDALLRRISQHIHFQLPDNDAKIVLYKNHIPEQVRKESIDFDYLSKISIGFSGGDIKNATQEAMVYACIEAVQDGKKLEEAVLKQKHIENEILKIIESKKTHSGMNKKPIGIAN